MTQLLNDQAYVEFTAKLLVQYPEDVKVEREISERGVLIKLFVHPEDLGAIIGRGGNTVMAIRQILRTIGMKNNAWVALKVEQIDGIKKAMPNLNQVEQKDILGV